MLNREFVDGEFARRDSSRSEMREQRAGGVCGGGASASGGGVEDLNGYIGNGKGQENGKGKAVEAIYLVSDSE